MVYNIDWTATEMACLPQRRVPRRLVFCVSLVMMQLDCTVFAQRLSRAVDDRYLGVILRDSVDISPVVSARLESLPVRVGQHVSQGATLAQLRDQSVRKELSVLHASLNAVEAELSKAVANAEAAKNRLDRRLNASQGAFSQEEIEDAETLLAVANATQGVAAARVAEVTAMVAKTEGDLEQLKLTAPFDGMVNVVYAEVGAIVSSERPVLRLVGSSTFRVRFAVPVSKTNSLSLGEEILVHDEATKTKFPARIQHIASEVDPAVELVLIEAVVLHSIRAMGSEKLRSGQTVRVAIGKAKTNALENDQQTKNDDPHLIRSVHEG